MIEEMKLTKRQRDLSLQLLGIHSLSDKWVKNIVQYIEEFKGKSFPEEIKKEIEEDGENLNELQREWAQDIKTYLEETRQKGENSK